ncbi:hypothetical protein LUZ63_005595 [Rhynchospora breviuscula]|uniref:GTD-binding domain-containing protein n=1 Tax=Rhynchospora breviuscula TaxID=2022672 RepID=A0A9Q0CNJ9_9POAL|nr:hypothetical protein LUZ63_005595 [Rhynchospora breviuscula]
MSDNEFHFSPCHVSPYSTPCRCCSDHRRRIDQLLAELDAERAAAATAAAESMAMIRRLQREKSDTMLELRQFRRFAEEQMARYPVEIEALEEVLFEREERILSLSNELEDCKKVFDDLPQWLNHTLDDATIMEKQVVKQSPISSNQIRHLSSSSSGSRLDFDKYEYDDIPDHACTIDTVQSTSIPKSDEYMDSKSSSVVGVDEEEIRKLCERVKVLEKERESMREVINSMEMEKKKGIKLKEIKQKLSEESGLQKKRVVKRGGFFKRFAILPILKFSFQWIKSTFLAKKKPLQIRYTFGRTAKNVGLLVLLHMSPATRQKKILCFREPKGI